MTKEMIKRLFVLKLKTCDALIDQFPEPIKSSMVEMERAILEGIYEVAESYMGKVNYKDKSNGIKNIDIQ